MHKWLQLDKSTIILCDRCSKKEYKVLDIRKKWDKNEINQQFSCAICGVTETIARTSTD